MVAGPPISRHEGEASRSTPAGLVVETVASTHFGQNAYVVMDPARSAALLVDPGFGCVRGIGERLEASGSRLDLVLLTHEHFDHIGNLNEVRANYGGQVVSSRACAERLGDPKKNLSAFHGGLSYSADPSDVLAEDVNLELDWLGHHIRLHPAPGHSPGSICIEIERRLFTGDTLIPGTRTVAKLPGGSRARLAETLNFIFSTFPGDTRVYPGHGPAILLGATSKSIHL
jgi:hydroxyacylglutathione hydrolase